MGRGHSPLTRPHLQWGGGHPLPHHTPLGAFGVSILAHSALDPPACAVTNITYFMPWCLMPKWSLHKQLCITANLKKTRSSAVAKRPRDASCLSVVSFVASIVQYLKRSFFIISYFSFRFISAYYSILFCCLRRNVKPCCHT